MNVKVMMMSLGCSEEMGGSTDAYQRKLPKFVYNFAVHFCGT